MLLEHWWWLQYAGLLMLGGVLLVLERRWPRRTPDGATRRRWWVNLGLYALGIAILMAVFEPLEQAAIRIGASLGWGGLADLPLPPVLKVLAGVLVVDLLNYALHAISHFIPLLWRLHQVHHADEAIDVSTSVRHHPLEMMANTCLALMACTALGIPLYSLIVYTVLQLAHTLFCHANVAVPAGVDRWLRWCIVTPDMHRVHHSARMDEGNSNFSMVFPWWDRLFRTYRAQPVHGHEAMVLGLVDESARGGERGLLHAVGQPFRPLPR